jgi:UDP:flavonoid glycosyltransferase YjiC (YdhE family)
LDQEGNALKKFLFTTLISNDLGLLTRSLPIARELAERGHRVAFCTPTKAPAKLISDAGFDNIVPKWPMLNILAGDLSYSSLLKLLFSKNPPSNLRIFKSFVKHMHKVVTSEIWNVDQFTNLMIWNRQSATALTRSMLEVITRYQPDAVVDFWNPGACLAARVSGRPLITVIQADMHPKSGGLIWWKKPPLNLPSSLPHINAVLADNKLRRICNAGELFIGDLTLVVGMPETDPLPQTAEATYIGPILWQKPDEKMPEWFAELSDAKPVIWAYTGNPRYSPRSGTPFDSAAVMHACIAALRYLDVQVVLTTGHHQLPQEVLPLPDNFRYASYVPGLAMAERSDLLIHHGGYGSCQTGLFTGTPALAIPTISERESNARRIAALGAGDFILPTGDDQGKHKQVSAEQVREKVKLILSDPSYGENAGRISREMKTHGGAAYAAGLIEDFVCNRDGTP